MKFIRSEQSEQVELVDWLEHTYPYALFTASAGGMRTSIGTAIKMKRAGYRKGCPDILIFEPRGIYHGLMIELKREKNAKKSDDQIRWIVELATRGYKAEFCFGCENAKSLI